MSLTAPHFPAPSAGTPWPPPEAKGSVLLALPGGAWQVQVDHLRIDADGAPNAYHPDNTPGLDHPGNAGWSSDPSKRKHWWPSVVVGDIGPDDHGMGEASIALAQALAGQAVNARNGSGQAPGPYQIVVFPRSCFAPAWPVDAGQVEARVVELIAGLSQ